MVAPYHRFEYKNPDDWDSWYTKDIQDPMGLMQEIEKLYAKSTPQAIETLLAVKAILGV